MYSVRNWIGVGAAALLAGALTFATTAGFAMPRYDGLWSISIVTTKATASRAIAIRCASPTASGNSGDIAVDVAGRVGGDGLVTGIRATATRGPRAGRLAAKTGAGTWRTTTCAGSWTAERWS